MPWIECLTAMGHANPVFEQSGFRRIGVSRPRPDRTAASHARIYGSHALTAATVRKSLRSEPVYYVWDNRGNLETA